MRSSFLSTLCILTFVWNSYKIYNQFSTYQKAETFSESLPQTFEQVQEIMSKDLSEKEQDEMDKTLQEMTARLTPVSIKTGSIMAIISAILLILGGVWMWDLKKRGFWVYLAGSALGIIAPIVVFGGAIGWTIGLLSGLLALLFSGLYYSQFKQLS